MEFERNLFLKLESIDGLLDIRIVTEHEIETDKVLTFESRYPNGMLFEWNPKALADNYTGKIFYSIHTAPHHAFLYFREMRYLIFCSLSQIKENDIPVLTWEESD